MHDFLLETIYLVYKKIDKGIEVLEETIFAILKKNLNNKYFVKNILKKFFNFENSKTVTFIETEEKL